MGKGPAQISHGGSQGFKSPHLHPNLAGQSVASVEPATLTASCGRAAAARSSHSSAGKASSDQAALPLGPTLTTQRGRRQLLPTGDARAHPAYLGRPPGRPGPTANHLSRQRPSPSRPPAGPVRPAPASRARLQPRADDVPSWTRRATTPTPSHPSHAAAGPRHARDLIPVGHSGRRNARTPDAGRWRPDSGHLDAQTPAPDTGHLDRPRGTPDARTGHWTPDARHECGHGDDSTACIRTSLATTRATAR
jgi:hypothetical protein